MSAWTLWEGEAKGMSGYRSDYDTACGEVVGGAPFSRDERWRRSYFRFVIRVAKRLALAGLLAASVRRPAAVVSVSRVATWTHSFQSKRLLSSSFLFFSFLWFGLFFGCLFRLFLALPFWGAARRTSGDGFGTKVEITL